MDRTDYILHYFNFKNAGGFLLISFIGLIVMMAVLLTVAGVQMIRWKEMLPGKEREDSEAYAGRQHIAARNRAPQLIESFYEMVFSSTSVLLFLSLYYIIDERIQSAAYYWSKYQNVILLIFILMSVILTNWLDGVLVKLTKIHDKQKASIRLASSFYIILILMYIKFIYEDANYDTLIMYFITLAAGRFLYFDTSVDGVLSMLEGVIRCLPILVLVGIYSAFICWYGFRSDFLLKSNGVILSTLIAHLFMDLSIFILHHTRMIRFFIPMAEVPAAYQEKRRCRLRTVRKGTGKADSGQVSGRADGSEIIDAGILTEIDEIEDIIEKGRL